MDGKHVPRPWNVCNLWKYFPSHLFYYYYTYCSKKIYSGEKLSPLGGWISFLSKKSVREKIINSRGWISFLSKKTYLGENFLNKTCSVERNHP